MHFCTDRLVDIKARDFEEFQLNQELAQKPEITSISNDVSVILGKTATLQVEASNPLANASLNYQWYSHSRWDPATPPFAQQL